MSTTDSVLMEYSLEYLLSKVSFTDVWSVGEKVLTAFLPRILIVCSIVSVGFWSGVPTAP